MPGKTRPRNDLLFVKRDVKLYSLIQSRAQGHNLQDKAKDLTSKAKYLAFKVKDMTFKAKVKDWIYKAKDEAAPKY